MHEALLPNDSEVLKEILCGYQGYLQTDAYSAYEQFDKKGSLIVLVGCMAHVRRNFVKIIDARGKGAKKSGSAEVALEYIRRLYAIEKIARERELSPEEPLALRKDKAEPILKEFKAWMDNLLPKTPPKGLLGKALSYALSNWSKLMRYLKDANIPIDNNVAKNAISPFVVGRKNWLFAGHPNGAHAAATLCTLIDTAKACGVELYHYLRYVFEKLPYAQSEGILEPSFRKSSLPSSSHSRCRRSYGPIAPWSRHIIPWEGWWHIISLVKRCGSQNAYAKDCRNDGGINSVPNDGVASSVSE